MSSFIRRIIWNTRERLTSTDLQDVQTLQHRALLEATVLLASGGGTRRHGVVSGLQVTVLGGGMDVSVSAGLATIAAIAPTADDSASQWVELESAQTVTVGAADPVNPRWDVIEIEAADAVELSSLRDIFNPALGTFTPATVEKRRRSTPTLYVTAGTPAAVPTFPSGSAGRLPLGYVYVPAVAVALDLNSEVLCRPMLSRLDSLRNDTAVQVRGGGVSADGTTATVELHGAQGTFDDGTPWEIDDGTVLTPNTVGATAAYPNAAADTLYHAYAVKARYPAGYDADLATREFLPGAAARTALGGGVADGVRGCFVIVQETGVTTIPDADTAPGHPASSLNLSASMSGLPGQFTPITDAIYLGSYLHDQSASLVFEQETHGDEVRGPAQGGVDWNTAGSPATETVWTNTADTITVLPPTARMVDLVVTATPTGNATASVQSLQFGSTNTVTFAHDQPFAQRFGWMRAQDADGNLTFAASGTWASDPRAQVLAYQDSCLARRR